MWIYEKKLEYPVRVTGPDARMAKNIITQYGGPDGELAASLRYLTQRYTMPIPQTKAVLTDIGREELAHMKIVAALVYNLMKDAPLDDIKKAGLDAYCAADDRALYFVNAAGASWTATYIQSKGDPVTDLHEDMAAEQKARRGIRRALIRKGSVVSDSFLWYSDRKRKNTGTWRVTRRRREGSSDRLASLGEGGTMVPSDAVPGWIEVAEEDLEVAELCFAGGKYLYSTYLCQQAVEKALKACIAAAGDVPMPIHHLPRLAQSATDWDHLENSQRTFLRELSAYAIEARYPERKERLRALCTRDEAARMLGQAKEVVAWLRGRAQKLSPQS